MIDIIYDCECYPNVFTCSFELADGEGTWVFEISDRVNNGVELFHFLTFLQQNGYRMVGFNSLHYDYPLLHHGLIKFAGETTYQYLYQVSQAIFASNSIDHLIWGTKRYVPQLDLFKIHHFDNRAKSTSLKAIEFAMRSSNVEDLPFPPNTMIPLEGVPVLISYNQHDVIETKTLYTNTLPMIRFREELGERYINHNDTKIGKDTFINQLEVGGVPCFDQNKNPIQTIRSSINLNDAVFPWVQFIEPEFNRIKQWFQSQVITETKGIFENVSASVKGFQFDFGLGGIHGSINNAIVKSNEEWAIIDLDVTSYYPSLAIRNRVYPQHLSEAFCDIYADIMKQRKSYAKGTPENAMLKLALNGVYGDSNNVYSPFYDPLYTMTITINGQLLLCALAEQLLQIDHLILIQVNTDGLTVKIRKDKIPHLKAVAKWWEEMTGLQLEANRYTGMWIRDVNSYIAIDEEGKVKRKGAYAHVFNPSNINVSAGDLEWHKNHSARIVARTAEFVLTNGTLNAEELITAHQNLYDFCCLAKVSRPGKLLGKDTLGVDHELQNITRYYVSETGVDLIKLMKPLKGQTDWRRIGIDVGWKVTVCNKIEDAIVPVNYDYYIQRANDLITPLRLI